MTKALIGFPLAAPIVSAICEPGVAACVPPITGVGVPATLGVAIDAPPPAAAEPAPDDCDSYVCALIKATFLYPNTNAAAAAAAPNAGPTTGITARDWNA